VTFLYVEGDAKLAAGFRKLFERFAGAVRVVPCGSKAETQKRWAREREEKPNHRHLLLIDSDRPAPKPSHDEEFFMVQMMENWFLVDVDLLEKYFGQGFNRNAIPRRPVEEIPQAWECLKKAVEKTKAAPYKKVFHGGSLLGLIDLDKVAKASRNFERLISGLNG